MDITESGSVMDVKEISSLNNPDAFLISTPSGREIFFSFSAEANAAGPVIYFKLSGRSMVSREEQFETIELPEISCTPSSKVIVSSLFIF